MRRAICVPVAGQATVIVEIPVNQARGLIASPPKANNFCISGSGAFDRSDRGGALPVDLLREFKPPIPIRDLCVSRIGATAVRILSDYGIARWNE
jgi:hypothetical protein